MSLCSGRPALDDYHNVYATPSGVWLADLGSLSFYWETTDVIASLSYHKSGTSHRIDYYYENFQFGYYASALGVFGGGMGGDFLIASEPVGMTVTVCGLFLMAVGRRRIAA